MSASCKSPVLSPHSTFGGKCTNPVYKDGYCQRRHPLRKVEMFRRRIKKSEKIIADSKESLIKLAQQGFR